MTFDDAETHEEFEETPDLPEVQCPAAVCGSEDAIYLGQLGQRLYFECRDCGLKYSYQPDPKLVG